MPAVARPGKNEEIAIDLPRKENGIPVKGDERVLQPDKVTEILCFGDSNGGAIEITALHHVISVLNFDKARIIRIFWWILDPFFINERDGLAIINEMNSIFASPKIEKRDPIIFFSAEDPDEAILERHDARIEDTGDAFGWVPFG